MTNYNPAVEIDMFKLGMGYFYDVIIEKEFQNWFNIFKRNFRI